MNQISTVGLDLAKFRLLAQVVGVGLEAADMLV
jgi:hypothetical protein